ncbi:sensor histidine kinase [Cohnella sp. GCM10012308]|uniref:sensor histidine kinase n=1 Tax=Cohnella sp. GCM10012308 TaxID=3317329 RepID=UPI003612591D
MKSFGRLSIRTQVLLIGALIVAIIPFVIVRVYQQSSATIIDQNTEYNTELVSILKQRVSANYANVSALMMNLGYDGTLQKFLLETDKLKLYDLSQKVESLMSIARNTNQDILDIVAVGRSGSYTSLAGRTQHIQELMATADGDGTVHYRGYSPPDKVLDKGKLLFGMNIFASDDTQFYGEKIGYILVILDIQSIHSAFEGYPRLAGTNFFMMDDKGVIYANGSEWERMLGSMGIDDEGEKVQTAEAGKSSVRKIGGKKYAVQTFALPEISGKIVTAVPIHNLMKELERLRQTSYWLLAVTLLVVSVPYAMLMVNILRPLTRLMRFMKRLKGGNLEVLHDKVDLKGYAEIEVISSEFNTMMTRINDLTGQLVDATSKLYRVDLEKQRAEYAYLQSQINPHFLSNTLDSIKGIAIVRGNRDIFEMTTALSSMLRYSIKGKDEVRLADELKIAEACVKIHQGRFPGRLTFRLICPEGLRDIVVPRMIVQPIVENALGHGLEPRGRGGVLLICAAENADGRLEIAVEDNGVGIEPDRLALMMASLASKNAEASGHIGVRNVHNRLWLRYGEPCGVRLESEPGRGTKVVLTLAGRRADGADARSGDEAV